MFLGITIVFAIIATTVLYELLLTALASGSGHSRDTILKEFPRSHPLIALVCLAVCALVAFGGLGTVYVMFR